MNDNEILQAILNKLDGLEKGQELLQQEVAGLTSGQEALRQDVSGLKEGQELLQQEVAGLTAGQEALKQDVTNLKQGQDSLQQQVTKTNIILENDIGKKLSALFDGHALDTEMIKHISETVETINDSYAATDIVTRVNTAEINKLKAKIG